VILLFFSRLQQIYDGVGVLIFGVSACLHWVDGRGVRPSESVNVRYKQ